MRSTGPRTLETKRESESIQYVTGHPYPAGPTRQPSKTLVQKDRAHCLLPPTPDPGSYSICAIISVSCSCYPKNYTLEVQNKKKKNTCVSAPDPHLLALLRDSKLSPMLMGNPGWHQHSHWKTLSAHHKNLPSPSAVSVPAWEGEGWETRLHHQSPHPRF